MPLSINRANSYRLLIVEDSPAEVRLIQEAICEAELLDYVEIEYAYDGDEACETIDMLKTSESQYDMILIDMLMPKVSGKEVLEKIKTDPDTQNIPVIMVSNSDYKTDIIECYRLGADGYFQKPDDFKKLVDFFISIRRSIEVRHKLSIYYIEKTYDELAIAS